MLCLCYASPLDVINVIFIILSVSRLLLRSRTKRFNCLGQSFLERRVPPLVLPPGVLASEPRPVQHPDPHPDFRNPEAARLVPERTRRGFSGFASKRSRDRRQQANLLSGMMVFLRRGAEWRFNKDVRSKRYLTGLQY